MAPPAGLHGLGMDSPGAVLPVDGSGGNQVSAVWVLRCWRNEVQWGDLRRVGGCGLSDWRLEGWRFWLQREVLALGARPSPAGEGAGSPVRNGVQRTGPAAAVRLITSPAVTDASHAVSMHTSPSTLLFPSGGPFSSGILYLKAATILPAVCIPCATLDILPSTFFAGLETTAQNMCCVGRTASFLFCYSFCKDHAGNAADDAQHFRPYVGLVIVNEIHAELLIDFGPLYLWYK